MDKEKKTVVFSVKAYVEDYVDLREVRDDLLEAADKMAGVDTRDAWYEEELAEPTDQTAEEHYESH